MSSFRSVGAVSSAATDKIQAGYHRDEKINIFSKKHSETDLPENENLASSSLSWNGLQSKFKIVKQLKKIDDPIKTEDSTPN